MKQVVIKVKQREKDYSAPVYDFDDIHIQGFDYLDVCRFGKWLSHTLGADDLIIHEVTEDGCEGCVRYDVSVDYPDAEEEECIALPNNEE